LFRNYNDNAIHSIGSTDCEFRRLTLHTSFITGIYLTSGSNRCLIEKCSFWDNGHGGIELASTRRTIVRKNRFVKRDLGDGCGGNGAHMWLGPVGALADSNLVENNIAFGTGRFGYRGPFAAIAGSYNIIRHNSLIDGGGGAIALLDGGHNTVVNNACDVSASVAHAIAVFPNACRDSFHYFTGNCFYAQDPTAKYWWNNVRYNSVAEWESAGAQTGNIDSLPGFSQPDSEDLHLLGGSACIDRGTPDSAAVDDYDGITRPQGSGFDIGAYEFFGTGIEAMEERGLRKERSGVTVVRGVLLLPPWLSPSICQALFDISGRKALDLQPGPNDISRLAPGVYFVSGTGPGAGEQGLAAVQKVIISR
jgi:parallel beta-helix repeat protein